MAEHGARQHFQVLGIEGLGRGRGAVGHTGEGQGRGQLARALLDQVHGVLAHVLGRGVFQQVQARDDRRHGADQVVAQASRHVGGQLGLGHGGLGLGGRGEGGGVEIVRHGGRACPDLPLWETSRPCQRKPDFRWG